MLGRWEGQIAEGPEVMRRQECLQDRCDQMAIILTSQILHAPSGSSTGVSNCVPHATQISKCSLLLDMLPMAATYD